MDIWFKINLTMLLVMVVCLILGCKPGGKWNSFDYVGHVTLVSSVWSWLVYFIARIWSA